jgi:MFS family permease
VESRPIGDWRRSVGESGGPALAYLILLCLAALDAAGYSVIAPVVPALANSTGAGPAVVGAVVAAFPVGMLAGFVAGVGLVRRVGCRATLLLALAVVAGGSAGFAAASTVPAFLVARLVAGFGSGGLWIGVTFATLERWPQQEYVCMSRIYAAYSVGGLIGPGFGALGGTQRPFLGYLGAVLAGAVVAAVLPAPRVRRTFRPDRTVLRRPGFRVAAVGITLAVLGTGVADGVLPVHFASHLSQLQIALAYLAMGGCVALGSVLAAGRPAAFALAGGSVLLTAGLALAGAADRVPVWLVALGATGLGIGAAETGSTGVLLDAVPVERIVSAMVVWSQLAIVGYLVGPAVGGPLAASLGFASLGLLPLAGLLVLAAVAVGARRRPRHRVTRTAAARPGPPP